MILGMLCIIAVYGIGIALVHWQHARARSRLSVAACGKHPDHEAGHDHYLLITGDHQHQIEWIIRSLLFYAWIKGKDIRITVLDEGSSDDTTEIVRRFATTREGVQLLPADADGYARFERLRDQATVIRLNGLDQEQNVYLFQE